MATKHYFKGGTDLWSKVHILDPKEVHAENTEQTLCIQMTLNLSIAIAGQSYAALIVEMGE